MLQQMDKKTIPYRTHVLVCVNDREGARASCADHGGVDIREYLKKEVADRGWTPRVRVSQTGCLGLCAKGPNVIVYPEGIVYHSVTPEFAPSIVEDLARMLESDS